MLREYCSVRRQSGIHSTLNEEESDLNKAWPVSLTGAFRWGCEEILGWGEMLVARARERKALAPYAGRRLDRRAPRCGNRCPPRNQAKCIASCFLKGFNVAYLFVACSSSKSFNHFFSFHVLETRLPMGITGRSTGRGVAAPSRGLLPQQWAFMPITCTPQSQAWPWINL